jgi:hypothetical protein
MIEQEDLTIVGWSSVGQVIGVVTDGAGDQRIAAVRFRYRKPPGGQRWSAPIGVLPGQRYKVVTP